MREKRPENQIGIGKLDWCGGRPHIE